MATESTEEHGNMLCIKHKIRVPGSSCFIPSPGGGCRKSLFVGRVSDSVTRQAVEIVGLRCANPTYIIAFTTPSGGGSWLGSNVSFLCSSVDSVAIK